MKMMNNLLRRRFVNIITENCESATCSLHRLNVSDHLFYPSTAKAADQAAAKLPAAAAISTLETLPEPTFSFQPEPRLRKMKQLFALVNPRSSESRILWRSPKGVTFVYDADNNCSHAMPSLDYKGCMPISISIPRSPNADAETLEGEDLYVMSSRAYSSFQVLTFGDRTYKSPCRRSRRDKPWQWDSLPPPPLPQGIAIISYTVLADGVTICVTAMYFGPEEKPLLTCLFDTVRREWRQVTGGRHCWDLPFEGGAEYVPDLKLWLGFCRDVKQELCAYDLSAAAAGEAPTLKHRLGELVQMPKEWDSVEPRLINLGDGRFCVARIMQEVCYEEDEEEDDDDRSGDLCVSNIGGMLAVLTGVEMVRGEEGFRMVAHKSLSYMFGKHRIESVL